MSRLLRGLEKVTEVVCVAAFVALFLAFLAQIGMRYLAGQPLSWPDETIALLFVWVSFVAGGILVSERQHVSFDLAYEPLPPRAKRVAALLGALGLIGLFGWGLPVIIDYVDFSMRQPMPVLPLPYAAIYGSMAVLGLAILVRAAISAVRLLRPGWERHV